MLLRLGHIHRFLDKHTKKKYNHTIWSVLSIQKLILVAREANNIYNMTGTYQGAQHFRAKRALKKLIFVSVLLVVLEYLNPTHMVEKLILYISENSHLFTGVVVLYSVVPVVLLEQ